MQIVHKAPEPIAWQRVKERRTANIASGFEWDGHVYQTGPDDLRNVSGRVGRITAQQALGDPVPDFTWRTLDNADVLFTAQQFLRFAVALDEWIEQQYQESWKKEE